VTDDRLPVRTLLPLVLLSATAPVSSDLYLASFPEIRDDLHTNASLVQLTLTAFLVGIGVGQVLWGPVSDHVGRYRPMLVGACVALAGSVGAVLAPTIGVLIVARLLQALGGAACVVAGSASIADRVRGFALVRTVTLMGAIIGLAPIVAPTVGGLLAERVPWRVILGIICCFTVCQLVAILVFLRETMPPERRSARINYGHIGVLFRRPQYIGHVGTQVLGFVTLMTYVSSSSFVYQRFVGLSSTAYGLCFAVNAVGLMTGNYASSRLARHRVHPARTVGRALPVTVTMAALMVTVVLAHAPHWLLLPPLFGTIASLAFVSGNCNALAIEQARDVAGSGSGVNNGVGFFAAGVISPLGGIAGEDTAVPMVVTMLVTASLAALCFFATRRYMASRPELETAYAPTV